MSVGSRYHSVCDHQRTTLALVFTSPCWRQALLFATEMPGELVELLGTLSGLLPSCPRSVVWQVSSGNLTFVLQHLNCKHYVWAISSALMVNILMSVEPLDSWSADWSFLCILAKKACLARGKLRLGDHHRWLGHNISSFGSAHPQNPICDHNNQKFWNLKDWLNLLFFSFGF